MIMSLPAKVDPLSVFMSDPASNPLSSCGMTALSMLPKPRRENADALTKTPSRLPAMKRAATMPPSTPQASTSRALQPVDTNLTKDARQAISRSRSSTPASSSRPSPTKKVRSPSSKDVSASSRSEAKAAKLNTLLLHSSSAVTLKGDRISVKVPQRLPTPRLTTLSSPYEDLAAHLARHNLITESRQVEQFAIPTEYLLTQYLELAHLGKCSLYHQTKRFLDANQRNIVAQVQPGQALPATIALDVTELVNNVQLPPTHLFAVHSDGEAATLYAVHAPVLVLQCVSIPFLPASKDRQEDGKVIKDMPTLSLRIPAPQHFGTMMRWLYSQSATSLLHELLPLKHIISYLARRSLAKAKLADTPEVEVKKEQEDCAEDLSKLSSTDLVEAMSTLSTRAFLELLQTIQAVWKNGVAMGIVSWNFWHQLDNAWNLNIAAMIASKRRSQKKVAAAAMAVANDISAQLQSTRIE